MPPQEVVDQKMATEESEINLNDNNKRRIEKVEKVEQEEKEMQ